MPRADKLSPGGVKLLQEKHLAVIATIMRDGSPQTTPVWIDVEPDGSHILINTVMSYTEIADVLGIGESNVGVRLNRARQMLREMLEVRL